MNRQSDEYSGEWETPFHFLLCHLFSVATDWAEQCEWIDEKEIPQENKEIDNFDLHYISKRGYQITWCYAAVGYA